MENTKICAYCCVTNQSNAKFCKRCGAQLIQNNIQQNNNITVTPNQNVNNDSEGTKLGIISLILYFCGSWIVAFLASLLPSSVRSIFSAFSGLCPLIGLVIVIVGRVNYPNNKLLKVVMWVIIASMIVGIVLIILFLIWCHITCAHTDTSGCA